MKLQRKSKQKVFLLYEYYQFLAIILYLARYHSWDTCILIRFISHVCSKINMGGREALAITTSWYSLSKEIGWVGRCLFQSRELLGTLCIKIQNLQVHSIKHFIMRPWFQKIWQVRRPPAYKSTPFTGVLSKTKMFTRKL